MPDVSVIIPTYNRGYIIKEAVNSVLNQTLKDIEILVVDDGSTDDTKEVIRSLTDKRVIYFYKPNGGPASARNFGLYKARGEYIAFLDSDDLWPENYLEAMISGLKANTGYDAAYSPITFVYPDGRKVVSYRRPPGKSGNLTAELFRSSFIWVFAAVFRREIWTDFYFDEHLKSIREDSDVLLRLSLRTQFLFVPQVEAVHRKIHDNISVLTGADRSRLLVLERFYFGLGGEKKIPAKIALRRLSHAAREEAEDYRKKKARKAALQLYKRALKYWPYDLRLYWGCVRTLLLNPATDSEKDWKMPQPMGEPVGLNRFA